MPGTASISIAQEHGILSLLSTLSGEGELFPVAVVLMNGHNVVRCYREPSLSRPQWPGWPQQLRNVRERTQVMIVVIQLALCCHSVCNAGWGVAFNVGGARSCAGVAGGVECEVSLSTPPDRGAHCASPVLRCDSYLAQISLPRRSGLEALQAPQPNLRVGSALDFLHFCKPTNYAEEPDRAAFPA